MPLPFRETVFFTNPASILKLQYQIISYDEMSVGEMSADEVS